MFLCFIEHWKVYRSMKYIHLCCLFLFLVYSSIVDFPLTFPQPGIQASLKYVLWRMRWRTKHTLSTEYKKPHPPALHQNHPNMATSRAATTVLMPLYISSVTLAILWLAKITSRVYEFQILSKTSSLGSRWICLDAKVNLKKIILDFIIYFPTLSGCVQIFNSCERKREREKVPS